MAVCDFARAVGCGNFAVVNKIVNCKIFAEIKAFGGLSRKKLAAFEQTVNLFAVCALINRILNGDNGHSAVHFICAVNAVRDNPLIGHRACGVMDNNRVSIMRKLCGGFKSAVNRVLAGLARIGKRAELCDILYLQPLGHIITPRLVNNNNDSVDFRVIFKCFKAKSDNRLVIYCQKLLWAIGTHTRADAACKNNCGVQTTNLFIHYLYFTQN